MPVLKGITPHKHTHHLPAVSMHILSHPIPSLYLAPSSSHFLRQYYNHIQKLTWYLYAKAALDPLAPSLAP